MGHHQPAGFIGLEALERRQLLSGGPGDGRDAFVTQTNIVSDSPDFHAITTDPNLVNAWGISFGPTTPFWISTNGTSGTVLYNGDGTPVKLGSGNTVSNFVNIPGAGGQPSAPTGQVFNPGTGFVVSGTDASGHPVSGPAKFIFAGEDGGIAGWNPGVNPHNAVLEVDNSPSGAVYKGLAMGAANGNSFLYAADFHNNKIDVFDTSFHPATLSGNFTDRHIPNGFAPFNVQNINGNLYVTYAKQDDVAHDDVAGPGNGFIDVFNTSGKLIQRFDHGGFLNSPWGLAVAPSSWGRLAGDILVGQFGSGHIDIFNARGDFRGFLNDSSGKHLTIDGLWALTPGNGATGDAQKIYFSAGPDGESHGLFGSLTFNQQNNNNDRHDHGDNGNDGDRGDGHDARDLLDHLGHK